MLALKPEVHKSGRPEGKSGNKGPQTDFLIAMKLWSRKLDFLLLHGTSQLAIQWKDLPPSFVSPCMQH